MSENPLNQALRFLLELTAIVVFGAWGHSLNESGTRFVLALLFPLLFALLWGIFAVRGDPSRSGKTIVRTPGIIRLLMELLLFGAATWMLFNLGKDRLGWILGSVTLLHYIVSYDRLAWLIKQK
jgi:hypothetical protein